MKKLIKKTPIKPYRKGIVDDLLGFDENKIEGEIERRLNIGGNPNTDIKGIIRKSLGKVSRSKLEIVRQKKKVIGLRKELDKHTELLEKHVNLMVGLEKTYLNIMTYVNPKVYLKPPSPSFKSYRGKVYWGVSKYQKRGWVEFYIISEKKVLKQKLTQKQIKEIGKQKFIDKMIKDNMIQNSL